MVVRLGKVKEETKDTYPVFTAYDGNPFPPLIYWRLSSQ